MLAIQVGSSGANITRKEKFGNLISLFLNNIYQQIRDYELTKIKKKLEFFTKNMS
jgi:hypothetical protein